MAKIKGTSSDDKALHSESVPPAGSKKDDVSVPLATGLNLGQNGKAGTNDDVSTGQVATNSFINAVVTTDKADYAPGEMATITADHFAVGSTVEFEVDHVSGTGTDGVYGTSDDVIAELGGEGHDPWTVIDGGAGDLDGKANGTVVTNWYVNPDDSLGETFLLTATDLGTGESASVSFTDAPPPNVTDALIDLTGVGDFGLDGGVVYQQGQVGAGTGVFPAFVKIQDDPTEEGFNTDAKPNGTGDGTPNDAGNSATFNHSILLSAVPMIVGDGTNGTILGALYRQFLLDAHEEQGGGNEFISLDKLSIYQEGSPTLNEYTSGIGYTGGINHLVYDLDAGGDEWIALDGQLSAGSGNSDMALLIPNSLFINDVAHQYVYLYSGFGFQTGWGSSATPEEWALGAGTPVASKSGIKYEDFNADGVFNGADAGLADWTISAFAEIGVADGVLSAAEIAAGAAASAVTDGTGSYELTLDPGDYIIVETAQAGWFESPDVDTVSVNAVDPIYGEFGYAINLESGEEDTGNDFANFQQATKEGIKYEDFNIDGEFNGADAGLADWTIAAFADNDSSGTLTAGDTLFDSDVTDGTGAYSLTLNPGQQYIVVEQVSDQTGWFESPDDGTSSVNTFDAAYGEFGYVVTLDSGETESNNDFANFQQATKSGIKYEDENIDGEFNGADAGLDGWTIAAFADNDSSGTLTAGDTLFDSDVTDGTGAYSLTLNPGQQYIVVEQVSDQTGWFESPDDGTSSVNTFDADYGEFGYVVTLDSGETESNNDFANFQQATKSGIKYEDENIDGEFNGADAGLDGWTIAAFADNDSSGTLTAGDTLFDSDVTDGTGAYSLTLNPGQQYIVVEQVSDQTGWFESPDDGTSSVNTFDTAYGEFGYVVTLDSGETESNNDFANFQQATKEGIKYEDFNIDGEFNGADAGLDGWTIAAFADNDSSGTLTAGDTLFDSDVTDGTGAYSLTLNPGQQYIVVEQVSDQTGWFESPDDGTSSVNTFDTAYGEFGYVVTLDSGETESNNDFANFQQATKEGIKYEDFNIDGEFNGADAGLDGWTIAAFADNDSSGTLTAGDTLFDSDVTDGTGAYSLTLNPGQQYIVVEQVSDQTGWFESPDDGTSSVNTFDAAYGEFGYVVTLDSGETESNNDFANFQQATKEGIKYEDFNIDGEFNGADAGLDGWTIAAFADNDSSGTLTAGDTLFDSDVTDGTGAYSLTLNPGQQYIVVEQVSDQTGWFESPDDGTSSVNTFDAAYGEFGYVVTLDSGETESNNDFANFQQATKSGIKYEDFNADGVFNGADAGLDGWTIAAFAEIGVADGVLSAAEIAAGAAASAVTAGGGSYELTLDPGDYIIVETAQAGWVESPDVDTVSVNVVDPIYGEFGYAINLESGEEDTGNDFANHLPPSGNGMTPGFWKNHEAISNEELGEYQAGLSLSSFYETVFGVTLNGPGSFNPTLQQALEATGKAPTGNGGQGALLRHSTAAFISAASDAVDEDGAGPQDELNFSFAGLVADASILNILNEIDTNNNSKLEPDEVIKAVQDVYGVPAAESVFATDPSLNELASAFAAMNEQPHLDATAFPVVLDLDGDGLEFMAMGDASNQVLFDFNGDGTKETAAWVGSDDGFLAYDQNNDRMVNDGSEIAFADMTAEADTDLEALKAVFDSNHDDLLTAADDKFTDFGVWQDANGNGSTEGGEFKTLAEMGIVSLDLTSDGRSYSTANGQVTVHGEASFAYQDGSQGLLGDVALALGGPDDSSADSQVGGAGNDTLIGGSGNDRYEFTRGGGQDTVVESGGSADRMAFSAGVNPLDLVLSRQANDLRIAVYGTTDQVTVQNWYGGTSHHVETIEAGNGQTLLSSQVNQLIDAMAGFTADNNGMAWDQGIAAKPEEVQAVVAASWQ